MTPSSKKSLNSTRQSNESSQESTNALRTQIDNLIQRVDTLHELLEGRRTPSSDNQVKQNLQRLLVKSDKKWIILQTKDIEWIEAWGDYIRIHYTGKTYISRQKIGDIEFLLDPQQFLRIGRSAIIHVDCIKELEPMFHGDFLITLQDNMQLNLSRNYRDRLFSLFDNSL
jgi:DNA-binding LytR/AlgR family response regulator